MARFIAAAIITNKKSLKEVNSNIAQGMMTANDLEYNLEGF